MAKIIPARWRRNPWSGPRARRAGGPLPIIIAFCLSASVAMAAPPARKKAAPKPVRGDLASLARAYRGDPAPARRTALEQYAAAHAKDRNGPLARLALGVAAYEHKDFAGAVAALSAARLPQISDYAAYYLGAARLESNQNAGVAQVLAVTHAAEIPSPLAGPAYLLEARALKGTPDAVRLLRDRYAALPQPEGDLTLADCYQAVNDLPHAADFYQRVYYEHVSGDAASRAAAALLALRDAMGAAYPPPLPQQLLRRADRFLEIRDYARARDEYASALDRLAGPEREQARVRMGAADRHRNSVDGGGAGDFDSHPERNVAPL
ncbi:MAG: hypothetical protein LAQ30_28720, partial [Acidobacteriia bacterium]|nr:hypothetical protein [Terriglobia bacterium]